MARPREAYLTHTDRPPDADLDRLIRYLQRRRDSGMPAPRMSEAVRAVNLDHESVHAYVERDDRLRLRRDRHGYRLELVTRAWIDIGGAA